jgi:hypothetical protein
MDESRSSHDAKKAGQLSVRFAGVAATLRHIG